MIRINIVWNNDRYIQVLKQKVSTINFKCYEDGSNEIRQNMKAIESEETNSDETDNETETDNVVLLETILSY